jgi:hypothetical protein
MGGTGRRIEAPRQSEQKLRPIKTKKKKTTRKHLKQKGLEEWLKGQAQGPEFKHKYHHRRRKGKRQTNKNH